MTRPVSSKPNARCARWLASLSISESEPNSVHPCSTAQRSAPAIRAAPTPCRPDRRLDVPPFEIGHPIGRAAVHDVANRQLGKTDRAPLVIHSQKHFGRFVAMAGEKAFGFGAMFLEIIGHNAARRRIHSSMSRGCAARMRVIGSVYARAVR